MSYEGTLLMSGAIVRWPLPAIARAPEDLAIGYELTRKGQEARTTPCAYPACSRPATHTTTYYDSHNTPETVGYCRRHPAGR